MANMTPQIADLVKALAMAQGEFPKADRDRANDHFKNRYATLDAIIEAVTPALSKHGLAFSQLLQEDPEAEKIHLETFLFHESGQYLLSVYPIIPVQNTPQGFGSAITYARRYTLRALLGIAEEDDDGNAASQPLPARGQARPAGQNGQQGRQGPPQGANGKQAPPPAQPAPPAPAAPPVAQGAGAQHFCLVPNCATVVPPNLVAECIRTREPTMCADHRLAWIGKMDRLYQAYVQSDAAIKAKAEEEVAKTVSGMGQEAVQAGLNAAMARAVGQPVADPPAAATA